MAGFNTSAVIALTAQSLLLLSLICCVLSAKLPSNAVAESSQPQQQGTKLGGVITEGHALSSGTAAVSPQAIARSSFPIVSSTDDLEVVAHTGPEGLGRQKRYIGWGRRPSLRYSKATSTFDHDSLFNRMHNTFDKRADGPQAPISSFRELRMKQKVPNIQLLLPHMPMRNIRIPNSPDTDADDAAAMMINDSERPTGKLTQEDLEALAYLLEGDIQ